LIVLDTHMLVWLTEGVPSMGPEARRKADDALAADALTVSAISFWEVAMLHDKGRLELSQPVETWRQKVLEMGLTEVPVAGDVAIAAATLPGFHGDPADRIITATASLHGAELMTADGRILGWSGDLRRHDGRR
jgi:PIN domain nuclease of toxin-antitoxin system